MFTTGHRQTIWLKGEVRAEKLLQRTRCTKHCMSLVVSILYFGHLARSISIGDNKVESPRKAN